MNTIGKWAVQNGLTQCMGCMGYGKTMKYKRWNGAIMPYCTEDCYIEGGLREKDQ